MYRDILHLQSIAKWDETKHPRDPEGQFAHTGLVVVGDRTIQVVKPKRAMRDSLVPLDVEAFDQQFKADPNFYLSEGGGKNAIGTRYARFGQFIAENTSIEAAEVYVGHDGRVGFTNGRHRYAWLRDQGIKTIPVAMTRESVRYAKQYGYLSTQKWDEAKHPRDAEGQFTEAVDRALEVVFDLPVPPAFQELEEAWVGGVGDFGDPTAAEAIQNVEGYDDYQKLVAGTLRAHLGNSITAYRSMSEEEYGDWTEGGGPQGIVGVTVDPEVAKHWEKFALNTGPRKIASFQIDPIHVIMRGSQNESELVVDADWIDQKQLKVAKWDESQHPRDETGKFRGKSTYVPDHDAPEKGDWDWTGVDRNAMVGPGPKWTQQHRALVKDALRAWVGDPGSFHIHAHDAIAGAPVPGSGSGKEMRAQAEALLWELEHNPKTIPMTLYRGSGQRGDLAGPGRSYSWSEDRAIAKDFAKRYGGVVEVLPAGTARGLRLKDYTGEAFAEAQWIVRAGNNPIRKKEYSYGNTQIQIDPTSSAATSLNAARNRIRDEDRADNGKDVDPNHVTVRFGLLNDDLDGLRSFIAAQTPFEAYVGDIELFPASEFSEGAVPVVVRIIAPELHTIEAEIAQHAEFKEKNFPVYKPHCTLAYCKPEEASKYAAMPVGGRFLIRSITISHQSGVQETIPFGMTQKKEWDPRKHPRVGTGSARGGEFTEVLYSTKDALDSLLNDEKATIDPNDLRNFLKLAREMPPDVKEANLMHLHLDGMRVFDQDGLGIRRQEMPQVPKDHRVQFLKEMKEAGVEITKEWVDPLTLKPSQDEISARNVGEKIQKYKKGDRVFPPLLVSNENRLLDGHHHWGMMTALAVEAPDAGIKVPIYRLNIRTKFALALMHAYDREHHIERKSVSAKWDESQHPRDEEGQFATKRLAQFKTILPSTDNPRLTAFLLPDGTRLRTVDPIGGMRQPHETAIGKSGFTMAGLMALGVARYVPHVGVEIGKPLTLMQAQILADDWNTEYQTSIVLETVNPFSSGAGRELLGSKEFFDPTGHLLYHYSQNVFQKVKKADPKTGRYVTPFVSFDKQGDDQLRMIASLNSSRLATWGFTAEAEVLGMARYRITAVLDGRTSEFCRFIDGKIFQVADARRKVIEALNVQDPEDLRTVQPWPKQTKAAMAEFGKMSTEQLTERGLHIPPYHPYCRTLLRPIKSSEGELTETTPTIPADSQVFQAVTQADLKELGIEATPEEVAQWNEHIGMTPVELLSKLTGMPPRDVMTDGVGANPIQFDEAGNIGVKARGATDGLEFKVGALLDPFTGIFYLTQADLLAGTPKAEAVFLRNLFSSLIEMGEKSTATSVALGVAGNAAYYAKLGFLPDELDWDSIRTSALSEIESGKLQPVLASLSEEDRVLVIHLLQDKSSSALSALVDLPFTYGGRTIGEWVLEDATGTWGLDMTDTAVVEQAKAYLS